MPVLKFKTVLLIIFGVVIVLCFLNLVPQPILTSKVYHYFSPASPLYCFRETRESLPDVTLHPPQGRSIFFHETSCDSFENGKIVIQGRQACAVESAAKMNPNLTVYLLFTSPGTLMFEGTQSDRLLQVLLSYDNIRLMHLNFTSYITDTPLQNTSSKMEESRYAQSHASDFLRYLTLWKYGGIYLDLDVVVIKTLEDLPLNFAGAESKLFVAAGLLSFNSTGLGHDYAKMCVDDLGENYRGNEWGYNGPGVITRLARNVCEEERAEDMWNTDCKSFKVYPPEYFYPVYWKNWEYYFREEHADDVLRLSEKSHIVHVWNKLSENYTLPLSSKAAYVYFAQNYCPKVYEQCDEYF